ncbi:trypsin-like peptidase domain-containing protein [Crossiella sp. SN42]|uniref:S1C family serine protease n=1 Tax=Crossiella sp. SN42 TaxID=2944808 RepID=UPI00207D0475|nr:trypsin-like peptidase domain-containing protein [Crossiella sp. SN42]MCO1577349.1 trypsin-like peptidase domain-containing protein [Crossiella sp. SN42]
MSRMGLAAAAVVAVLAAGCTAQTGQPQVTTTSASTAVPDSGYADLVERVAPSVVTVRAGESQGSGVVFGADVVVSNQHVVGEQRQVSVRYADGSESGGTVLATDRITDLAVVRTERKNLPVAEFRRELPRAGDRVLAIGSPLGFANTVTAGIVSGLHREIPGAAAQNRALVDLIQTDASISPGNSGGALVDLGGRVVGINEAYIPPSAGAVSLGFAIPAATAASVAEQLLADGTAEHPYLGVSLSPLTPAIRDRLSIRAESGALVMAVVAGGPAAGAGVRPGDLIVRMGQSEVRVVEDVLAALRRTAPGTVAELAVLRGGERRTVQVTVGAQPG